MSDKFMCVYSEMEALKGKFDTEAGDLNDTATAMKTFQDTTVSTAIQEFKEKITNFQEQINSTETDLKAETQRVCGETGYDGEGWAGEKSANFVNSVFDEATGLAGCFKTLREDMEEINQTFSNLETKIAEVITELENNVRKVSDFCTENSDFTKSMEEASIRIDS
ncbi:MAG: hypothetical protein K2K16_11795 [Ruminococcus sp.]|nr:hypothetical protein [Ruminococcus sp.]